MAHRWLVVREARPIDERISFFAPDLVASGPDLWTGSDNCLECLWPAKYRFRSWLQPKVARLVAENGARIAGSLRL